MQKRARLDPFLWGSLILITCQTFTLYVAFREKHFVEAYQITPPQISLELPLVYFFGAVVLLGLLAILYVILGMFLDSISMMVLTLPFVIPIMVDKGIDFIWFGVFLTLLVAVGTITPPMGLSIYVMKGVLRDQVSLEELFLGAAIFVPLIMVVVGIVMVFPELATWLPAKMVT